MTRVGRSRWAPPAVLAGALAVVALGTHSERLGLSLVGGALLPVGALGELWSEYLAAWHGGAGGAVGAAPPALAVLGVLGAPLAPVGGPAALVAVLLLADMPLAGLSAYLATRRIPVHRWIRALAAATYGLLPPATAAAAQGRLDVVVWHVLLPVLLAGVFAVTYGPIRRRWLGTSALCALGVATAAAFLPVAYPLLLLVASIAFVAAPGRDRPRARAGAFAVLALLPPGLLLPWLPVLVAHPVLVLQGVSGPAVRPAAPLELLGLDPGGPGGSPVGAVVVVAALLAVVTRPTSRMAPAGGLVLVGVLGAGLLALVSARPVRGGPVSPAFAGAPLLMVGAGLLVVVLVACLPAPERARTARTRAIVIGAVCGVSVLAGFDVVAGREGPLVARSNAPTALLSEELASTGRGVLVLGDPEDPYDVPRLTAGRPPRFGDDALAPVESMTSRVWEWQRQLSSDEPEAVTSAVTSAAASGVLFVVLPPGEDGGALRNAAGELVAPAPPTSDGRTVVRLTPEVGAVTLIASEQARRSVSGLQPDAELLTPPAAVAVDAAPPEVGVRVSEGPEGRLLVLAAAYQPGWRATVDGDPAPIVRAWGNQVAVAVPPEAAEVRVGFDGDRHDMLLLGQLAAVLFTVLTALPSLRRSARRDG